MNLKKILLLTLSTLSLASTTAWADVTLRLSHNAAAGNPKDLASLRFAELVEKYSHGRVKVKVGGNAQFGDDAESLTNMRLGTLDLSTNSQGATSTIIKEFALVGLPFLFKNSQQAYQVVDGKVGEELNKYAEKKGLVVLALWDNGFRHLSNNTRPVVNPEDMKGLKVRTPPDPMTLDIMKALGANPAPLAFSELYIALQQGVFDAQENPLMNIYSSKLYEVQKYISLTGHKYETTPLLASKMVWQRLTAEDKAAIKQAAKEAGEYNRQLSLNSDKEVKEALTKYGTKINDVNQEKFIAATKSVYATWTKVNPEFAKILLDEVKKVSAE